MPRYNGHKNWNHWNVALWIQNDERLYYVAKRCIVECGDKYSAAKLLLWRLQDAGFKVTPDGAPYSVSSLRAALVGVEGAE